MIHTTEAPVQAGFAMVLRGRTSVVIARCLSTVLAAARIIVLRQRQIIESGNHEDLLAEGCPYAELYITNFRHPALAYQPWDEPARS